MLPRKEIYRKLKEYGLQEEVKEKWATDYTRVSSVRLMEIIEKHEKMLNAYNKSSKKKTVNDVKPEEITNEGLKRAFIKLVSTLQASDTLYADEAEDVLAEL